MSIEFTGTREEEEAKYYCVTWKKHGSNLKIEKFKKKELFKEELISLVEAGCCSRLFE